MVPVLSLVMCTIGTTDRLPRLAASLAAQSRRDFELIVVDQSTPGTLDGFLHSLPDWLSVTHTTCARGLSRARNHGLRLARAPIVGLPDDDAWYPEDLVSEVVARFDAMPQYDVLTGVTRDGHGDLSNGTFLPESADISLGNVWKSGNSNAIFFRREPAGRIGNFDETLGAGSGTPFGSGEETDFMLRLLRAGSRGRFMRDLVVHHDQVDQSIDETVLKRAALYAQGYGRVLKIHRYSPRFVLYRALRSLAAAGAAMGRGRWDESRRRLIWFKGILKGYSGAF